MNTITVQQAAAFLRERDSYLILTHKRPDGDTIGCAAGLCRGLRALGKTAHICPGTGATHLFTPYLEGLLAPEGYVPDTVVSVDIAARSLFTDAGRPWLERGVDLAFDHHPSQEFFARQTCLDAGRAACGELIYDVLKELGTVTADMAAPLYVAVSTDTGCFQYGNTTAASHRVAAALIDTGLDLFPLNQKHLLHVIIVLFFLYGVRIVNLSLFLCLLLLLFLVYLLLQNFLHTLFLQHLNLVLML